MLKPKRGRNLESYELLNSYDSSCVPFWPLEEAGGTEADVLNHCRQPGEHLRGCRVVDRILGKK